MELEKNLESLHRLHGCDSVGEPLVSHGSFPLHLSFSPLLAKLLPFGVTGRAQAITLCGLHPGSVVVSFPGNPLPH